jgi:hypothetical protein
VDIHRRRSVARSPVRPSGVVRERVQVMVHNGVLVEGDLRQDRLVQVGEPHLAGEVGDHLMAPLGGRGEPVQPGPHRCVGEVHHRVAVTQPPFEYRHDARHELPDPAERPVHPDDRLLQFGGSIEPLDPVPAQGSRQPFPIVAGQAGPFGVEPLQVRQQVLLRATGTGQTVGLALGSRPVQPTDVGEEVQ